MRTSKEIGDLNYKEVFDRDLLDYLARRYDTSVKRVISQFLKQSDIEKGDNTEYGFNLEANEIEILRDYYLRGVSI